MLRLQLDMPIAPAPSRMLDVRSGRFGMRLRLVSLALGVIAPIVGERRPLDPSKELVEPVH